MCQVKQEFHSSGFMTDVDLDPGCTLNKKIRNAQLAQYNFILGQYNALPFTPLSAISSLYQFLAVRLDIDFFCPLCTSASPEQLWERRRRRATL